MRIKGWEKRLLECIKRHAAEPFAYGRSDCFTLPMDAAIASTGEDPYPGARGYKSDLGAAKALAKRGFPSLADAFAAAFPEIHPAFAGRGDIGIVESGGKQCGVVIAGHELVGKSEQGAVFFSRSELLRAFKVG